MLKTVLETKPETVLVRNVFYLMSYAFRALDVRDYERIGSEEFRGMDDLLAEKRVRERLQDSARGRLAY